MTVATLPVLGNLDEDEMRLSRMIAIADGVDRKFDSFFVILYVPDVFLVLRDFRIKFHRKKKFCQTLVISYHLISFKHDVTSKEDSLLTKSTKSFRTSH